MVGHDIAVLLKLSLQPAGRVLSKDLAHDLFLSQAEISNSLRRSKRAGLLYWSDLEKRVNRPALTEYLVHGMRYIFPPDRGGLVRGIPTAEAALPLKEQFVAGHEVPPVWPYAEGSVQGRSFSPLYKHAPEAALADDQLYELLALCDVLRSGRARERALAADYLRKALNSAPDTWQVGCSS